MLTRVPAIPSHMMRPLNLTSVVAKVNRAKHHLDVLKQEVGNFMKTDLCEVRMQVYRRRFEWHQYTRREFEHYGLDRAPRWRQVDDNTFAIRVPVAYQSVTVRVAKQPPFVEWAVIAADVLNNLRSALDNLAWALTDQNDGPPPAPPLPRPTKANPKSWREVRFPVALSPNAWQDAPQRSLWGMRRGQIARVKKTQPFYRRKHPDRHWLAVLDELWNADKHRTLSIVQFFVGFEYIRFFFPEGSPLPEGVDRPSQLFDIRMIRKHGFRPLKGNAEEIARFRFCPKRRAVFLVPEMPMKMYTHVLFDVAFNQGPPTQGRGVIQVLEDFLNRVTAVVADFQPQGQASNPC